MLTVWVPVPQRLARSTVPAGRLPLKLERRSPPTSETTSKSPLVFTSARMLAKDEVLRLLISLAKASSVVEVRVTPLRVRLLLLLLKDPAIIRRSEERRVGKECRCRT